MAKGKFFIPPSKVRGVFAVAAESAHAFSRHTHDQYGIGVVVRGAQRSLSGRGIIEAEAGDVITVNPGEVHDGLPIDSYGRAWKMLYFDPKVLAEPISMVTGGRGSGVEFSHPALRDSAGKSYAVALFRAMTDTHGGHSEIEGQELLLRLLAKIIDHPNSQRPESPGSIKRALERIDDDPSLPLSLTNLAAIAGVSQFQLIRAFSRTVGLTPHAYLVQRRLQKVRRMIAAGESLASAALASGFADQSHMTRIFVRTYGMSPGSYAAAVA